MQTDPRPEESGTSLTLFLAKARKAGKAQQRRARFDPRVRQASVGGMTGTHRAVRALGNSAIYRVNVLRNGEGGELVGITQFFQAVDKVNKAISRLLCKGLRGAGPAAAELGQVLLAAQGPLGAA